MAAVAPCKSDWSLALDDGMFAIAALGGLLTRAYGASAGRAVAFIPEDLSPDSKLPF